jgi:hypothetical protein
MNISSVFIKSEENLAATPDKDDWQQHKRNDTRNCHN